MGNDARKREALEHQEEPKRIHAARHAKGNKNYKEIADLIIREASSASLDQRGMVKGMTEEKRFGNLKAADNFDYDQAYSDYEKKLIKLTNDYFVEDPDLFKNNRNTA